MWNFMNFVQNNGNQSRELFNGYKQFGDADKIKIVNEVNIMRPEHIHVNHLCMNRYWIWILLNYIDYITQ